MAEKVHLGIADNLVLGSMLAISTGIGVYYAWKSRRNSSNDDYLLGDRQLRVLPVSLSLMASFLSPITVLGFPSEIYSYGTQFLVIVVATSIAVIVAAEVFLPILHPLKITSVNEYLYRRYDSEVLRKVAALQSIVFAIPFLSVNLYGPSLALSSVTDLSVTTSIIVVGLICTFYTSVGGLKAIVWIDVFQMALLISGLLAVLIQGCLMAGGIAQVWRIAETGHRIQFTNFQVDFYAPNTVWNVVLGMGFQWTSWYSVSQLQVQRYCGMPTLTNAKRALYINFPGLVTVITIACLCGLVLYANYSDCDPITLGILQKRDQLMPYFAVESLRHVSGMPGLFVACVFSGSLSTLASGVAGITAMIWDDLLKDIVHLSAKHSLWVTKATAAISGMVLVGMAFVIGRIESVIQAGVSISGAAVGCFFVLFVLGIFWPRCNAKAATAGLLVGDLFCLWLSCSCLAFGLPKPILPASISGCPNNTSMPIVEDQPIEDPISGFFTNNGTTQYVQYFRSHKHWLYDIHYLWMPVIGFIVTLAVTVAVTLVTAPQDKPVDDALLSPLVRRWRARKKDATNGDAKPHKNDYMAMKMVDPSDEDTPRTFVYVANSMKKPSS